MLAKFDDFERMNILANYLAENYVSPTKQDIKRAVRQRVILGSGDKEKRGSVLIQPSIRTFEVEPLKRAQSRLLGSQNKRLNDKQKMDESVEFGKDDMSLSIKNHFSSESLSLSSQRKKNEKSVKD